MRRVACLRGRGDRRAGMVGGFGQVGSQQEEDAGEALLDARPEHQVIPGVGTSLAVELGRLATVSLVLLERAEPVEDLAAPGPAARSDLGLAQQLPGPLRLARLPGEDRRVHRSPVPALLASPPASAGAPARTARRRWGTRRGRALVAPRARARPRRPRPDLSAPSARCRACSSGSGSKLCQAAMERAALAAGRLARNAGGEQRMGEANAVPSSSITCAASAGASRSAASPPTRARRARASGARPRTPRATRPVRRAGSAEAVTARADARCRAAARPALAGWLRGGRRDQLEREQRVPARQLVQSAAAWVVRGRDRAGRSGAGGARRG